MMPPPAPITDLYALYTKYPHIVTDTRKIVANSLFFALKGPHFDGNHFVSEALSKGAAYVVSSHPDFKKHPQVIYVSDTLRTLQNLALHHRRQFASPIPFIAITGSNGKTTTKELAAAVLQKQYRTAATIGNLNNHIGIPLTLLQMPLDTEIAIIEMGANHIGEIANYCTYARPNYGLITNCGKAHLEGFGSEANVRKAKGELFTFLAKNKASGVFLCKDFPYLNTAAQGIERQYTYGAQNTQADIYGKVTNSFPHLQLTITLGNAQYPITTRLFGAYNLHNILAAFRIGLHFNVPIPQIIAAISAYTPQNHRSQTLHLGSNTFIIDAYNANPTSMKSAIENFTRYEGTKKSLLLGAMEELGTYSQAEHEALIQYIQQYHWANVLLIGSAFETIPHPYRYYPHIRAAKEWFLQQNFQEHTFLLKGSRAAQLESLLTP